MLLRNYPEDTLQPFQEEGAAFLAQRRRAGLLDEPGAGKTPQAVKAVDLIQAQRGMVICPANVRENWRSEFRKFSVYSRKTIKASTLHDLVGWQKGYFDVIMLSYEMATKWTPRILAYPEQMPFVIIDEAHNLKTPDTKRTKAILGEDTDNLNSLITWARQAWWVTGTPVPNSPFDIYTFLRFCNVMPLDEEAFKRRYFNAIPKTFGETYEPYEGMLPELRQLIANNSMQRLVADKLPPLFITSYMVDGSSERVAQMIRSVPGLDAAILQAMESPLGWKALPSEYVATLRRLIGEAKAVPYAANLLHELQNGKDKQVVFGIHTNTLEGVYNYLMHHGIRCVMVTGKTPEHQRRAAEFLFKNDPSCRVFIGNIKAAGVGITLTKSQFLDVLEQEWAPMLNWQAIKRIHRMTQLRTCWARLIGLANSFDDNVCRILARKTRDIAGLDGQIGGLLPVYDDYASIAHLGT